MSSHFYNILDFIFFLTNMADIIKKHKADVPQVTGYTTANDLTVWNVSSIIPSNATLNTHMFAIVTIIDEIEYPSALTLPPNTSRNTYIQ